MIEIDYAAVWKIVEESLPRPVSVIHGPTHWRRVERNGLLLATRTGADPDVIRLFALFHDSRRENDGTDPEHGARGAAFAAILRGAAYDLPDERFALLQHACVWHTHPRRHEDPTIGSCWDADRLDLGRVSIIPSPKFMSTAFGREIAGQGSIYPFLKAAGMSPVLEA